MLCRRRYPRCAARRAPHANESHQELLGIPGAPRPVGRAQYRITGVPPPKACPRRAFAHASRVLAAPLCCLAACACSAHSVRVIDRNLREGSCPLQGINVLLCEQSCASGDIYPHDSPSFCMVRQHGTFGDNQADSVRDCLAVSVVLNKVRIKDKFLWQAAVLVVHFQAASVGERGPSGDLSDPLNIRRRTTNVECVMRASAGANVVYMLGHIGLPFGPPKAHMSSDDRSSSVAGENKYSAGASCRSERS